MTSADKGPEVPPPVAPDLLKVALDGIERSSKSVQLIFDNQVYNFSRIDMGSRLFTVGLFILLGDIVLRIFQWFFRGVKITETITLTESMDDLFFVSLLVVAILMMASGLIANVYLVWSIQRGQREDAFLVREALETEKALKQLREPRAKT